MTTYSIIAMSSLATPPDVSRGDVINIDAPWDLIEGLVPLVFDKYAKADRVVVVDEMGITQREWRRRTA